LIETALHACLGLSRNLPEALSVFPAEGGRFKIAETFFASSPAPVGRNVGKVQRIGDLSALIAYQHKFSVFRQIEGAAVLALLVAIYNIKFTGLERHCGQTVFLKIFPRVRKIKIRQIQGFVSGIFQFQHIGALPVSGIVYRIGGNRFVDHQSPAVHQIGIPPLFGVGIAGRGLGPLFAVKGFVFFCLRIAERTHPTAVLVGEIERFSSGGQQNAQFVSQQHTVRPRLQNLVRELGCQKVSRAVRKVKLRQPQPFGARIVQLQIIADLPVHRVVGVEGQNLADEQSAKERRLSRSGRGQIGFCPRSKEKGMIGRGIAIGKRDALAPLVGNGDGAGFLRLLRQEKQVVFPGIQLHIGQPVGTGAVKQRKFKERQRFPRHIVQFQPGRIRSLFIGNRRPVVNHQFGRQKLTRTVDLRRKRGFGLAGFTGFDGGSGCVLFGFA